MSIQLSNVEFSYQSTPLKKVVNIKNWSVDTLGKHFIQGSSGSGKSTLLNLVSGLVLPDSGTINVLGEQLEKMSSQKRDSFRANNIGYIFQQFNLIKYLSAVENIQLAHQFSAIKQRNQLKIRIHSLLEELSIKSADWQRPIEQLSIGQQQRIAIARAFINAPKLILADEPTSSLDEAARDGFMSTLFRFCEQNKSTLLFVSHDKQLIAHFDTVEKFSDINITQGEP